MPPAFNQIRDQHYIRLIKTYIRTGKRSLYGDRTGLKAFYLSCNATQFHLKLNELVIVIFLSNTTKTAVIIVLLLLSTFIIYLICIYLSSSYICRRCYCEMWFQNSFYYKMLGIMILMSFTDVFSLSVCTGETRKKNVYLHPRSGLSTESKHIKLQHNLLVPLPQSC